MLYVEKLAADMNAESDKRSVFVSKNQDIITVCTDAIYCLNSTAMKWMLYAKYPPDLTYNTISYNAISYNESSQQLYIHTNYALEQLVFSKNNQQNVYVLHRDEDIDDMKDPISSIKIIVNCNQQTLKYTLDCNQSDWNDDIYSALMEAVRKKFELTATQFWLYKKVRGEGKEKYYIISRFYFAEIDELKVHIGYITEEGGDTLHLYVEKDGDDYYQEEEEQFTAMCNLEVERGWSYPRYCYEVSSSIVINDEFHLFITTDGTEDDTCTPHYVLNKTKTGLDKVKFAESCGILGQSQIIYVERQNKMLLFGQWLGDDNEADHDWFNFYFYFKTKTWHKLPLTAQFPNDTRLSYIQCVLTHDQQNIITVTNIGLIYVLNLDTLVLKKSCFVISKIASFNAFILSDQKKARNIIQGFILVCYKTNAILPIEIIDIIQLFYQISYIHLFHEMDHWKMSVGQLLRCE